MVRYVTPKVLLIMTACSPENPPQTLNSEPLIPGGDPEAIARTIDHPALPPVLATSEQNGVSVGVFQRGTGMPYLALNDSDNDGVFDLLTYSVLDADGNLLIEVEDFGMNGQADMRVNFATDAVQVFYEKQWLEAKKIGTGRFVAVDGVDVPLHLILDELGRNNP